MKLTLDSLRIDAERVERYIVSFIREKVREAGAEGGVLGLSGGVDSSTTAYLVVRALGRDKVMGLIMPDKRTTPEEDLKDAVNVAERLGIEYHVVDITPIYDTLSNTIPIYDPRNVKANGNIRARTRMIILYYYANTLGRMVIGTGDRSEILIGYFTKYGDGGVDILPLGCLYKSQVRQMALYLGVPRRIALKPSSPRLWPGHEAEKELGLRYEEVDLILHGMIDLGMKVEEVAEATGIGLEKILKVKSMMERSRHKREMPPIPRVPGLNELG